MYIQDVVASLRENYLKLAKEIDALRLTLSLMESAMTKIDFRLQVLEDMHPRRECEPSPHVSRETEGEGNGSAAQQLEIPLEGPKKAARVGKVQGSGRANVRVRGKRHDAAATD